MFLLGEGFTQSIVDRRVFVKQLTENGGECLFIVAVYVDDYLTYCEDGDAWFDFEAKWTLRYTASSTVVEAGSDFCGTTFTDIKGGSLSLGCVKLITVM